MLQQPHSSDQCYQVTAGHQQQVATACAIVPLTLQGLDPLSAKQAAKIYQLATECQSLGSDLVKQFQTLQVGSHAPHHSPGYSS